MVHNTMISVYHLWRIPGYYGYGYSYGNGIILCVRAYIAGMCIYWTKSSNTKLKAQTTDSYTLLQEYEKKRQKEKKIEYAVLLFTHGRQRHGTRCCEESVGNNVQLILCCVYINDDAIKQQTVATLQYFWSAGSASKNVNWK